MPSRNSLQPWLTVVPAFGATAAVTWMMRLALAPAAEAARRPGFPELREPQRSTAALKPIRVAELLSVRLGIVEWPASGDSAEAAEAFAGAWRKLRPLVEAGTRDGDDENQIKARQLFADWWKFDPEAALRFVSDPPGVFAERGGMFLLPLVAARDPRQAWKLSGLAMQRHERMMTREEVVKIWAHRAPEEAMAFAASLPAAQRAGAERAALRGWAAHHAADAIAWAAALPESWRKGELMKEAIFALTASDPAALASALRMGVGGHPA